ncbi:hypothetical protein ISCGN_001338 [Ixodes scapularis]
MSARRSHISEESLRTSTTFNVTSQIICQSKRPPPLLPFEIDTTTYRGRASLGSRTKTRMEKNITTNQQRRLQWRRAVWKHEEGDELTSSFQERRPEKSEAHASRGPRRSAILSPPRFPFCLRRQVWVDVAPGQRGCATYDSRAKRHSESLQGFRTICPETRKDKVGKELN